MISLMSLSGWDIASGWLVAERWVGEGGVANWLDGGSIDWLRCVGD